MADAPRSSEAMPFEAKPSEAGRGRLVAVALTSLIAGVVTGLAFVLAGAHRFEHHAAAHSYSAISEVPGAPAALVLGACIVGPGGGHNRVLENRLDAAAELWRADKVRVVIVSGDRSGRYDEPAAMRAGLLARGVPASAIVSDASGLRPREAVLRARDVLGHRHILIVAQSDTVGRALFVAHEAGIAASGFNAPGAGVAYGAASDVRRWLTAMFAWVDPRG